MSNHDSRTAKNHQNMDNPIVRLDNTWIPQIGQLVQPRYITKDWGKGEFGTIIGFVLEDGILQADVKHSADRTVTERVSLELIRPVQISL